MTTAPATRRRWLLVAAAVVAWAGVMTNLGGVELLPRLGGLASALVVLLAFVDREVLRPALRLERRALLGSAIAAAVMVAATYAGYPLVSAIWPGLRVEVSELYRLLAAGGLAGETVLWLLPIIVAEELLFRGTLWRAVAPSPRWAVVLASTGVYALAQFGSGSVALLWLSVACGLYWAVWRAWSGSLWPSLVSHAVWNTLVLVLWPLRP